MRLREYPGVRTWPPKWHSISASAKPITGAEIAILTHVGRSRYAPTICHMTVQVGCEKYTASLTCRDSLSCARVYDFLRAHIGRSVSEIGELEFPQRSRRSADAAADSISLKEVSR